jgi:integrase
MPKAAEVAALLAAAGMRVGEAIGFDRADAGLDADVLTVRNGEFRGAGRQGAVVTRSCVRWRPRSGRGPG